MRKGFNGKSNFQSSTDTIFSEFKVDTYHFDYFEFA